jgi:hypothetical protein
VSELPRSARGANPSARSRFPGDTTSTSTRSLAVVELGGPKPSPRSDVPVSGRAVDHAGPTTDQVDVGSTRLRCHDDDMLTVANAARLARRSVRTLRRAYLSGKLLAHRDGNGRGVSIRYGDLRAWLTAEVIAPAPALTPVGASARAEGRRRVDASLQTGNTELLAVALQRRRRRARAGAAPRR